MNIVVRSPNWIGDCIMSLPSIKALKNNFPDDDIFLVSKHYLRAIYKNIKEVKKIITIPDKMDFKDIFKISKNLRKNNFEFGILFTNSFASAFLFRLSGIKKLVGYNRDLRGFLLYKRRKYPKNEDHHTFFYMDLIEDFLGKKIKKDYSNKLLIMKDEKDRIHSKISEFGIDLGKPLIGISSSAAYGSAKEWFTDRFKELIKKIKQEIDCEVLLFGTERERKKILNVLNGVDYKIHNLAGRLDLREAIVTISLCNVFVSNDSGLMHIASSLKVPLIAIFGPTIPKKTAPLSEKTKVLYQPVDCAPCKYRECPFDHKCMGVIGVDHVFNEVIDFLGKERA